jgi:hypothetical protein
MLLMVSRPLAAQPVLTQVTESQQIAGTMPFEIPSLTLKARGTIAFLDELPQTAAVRSPTLLDGRELRITP